VIQVHFEGTAAEFIPKIHDLPSLFDQCRQEHFAALMGREGLVCLSRYATHFRYPGEMAEAADAMVCPLASHRVNREPLSGGSREVHAGLPDTAVRQSFLQERFPKGDVRPRVPRLIE
jgi:hypothetical protein